MKKRLLSVLCILILMAVVASPAAAVELIDLQRKGSITVSVVYDEKPVSGGKLTIYRVAEVAVEDWNFGFRYLDDFADCGEPLDNLYRSRLITALETCVAEKKLQGIPGTIDKQGTVTFEELELGLYLVVQTEASAGYYPANSFLVSLPGKENGKYDYDVDASPKMDVLKPKPTIPTQPTRPGGKLPQTGQTNWPIPMMAVSGMILFALGWSIYSSGKRNKDEI